MLNNIKHLNLPQEAIDLYLDAWRPKTRRSYFVYLRKWQTLCIQKNWNKLRPTVNQVIYFLTSLFRSGLSYGSVNLAHSALSSSLPYLDGKAVGQHPVICKILKGMYNRRPQQSRYSSTWDVDVVLEYIREMSPLSILPLKPTAHWRTGRDKTGQDRPVWQCAGLQDGLSLVFRTVLSMLNV